MIVPDDELVRIASARRQLDEVGYVDLPEELPIAERSLQFMRSELTSGRSGTGRSARVYVTQEFDFFKFESWVD